MVASKPLLNLADSLLRPCMLSARYALSRRIAESRGLQCAAVAAPARQCTRRTWPSVWSSSRCDTSLSVSSASRYVSLLHEYSMTDSSSAFEFLCFTSATLLLLALFAP
jgi:hypothetical protein